MNAHQAAERMLQTGLFYTASTLGHAFGESLKNGSRCINKIKRDPRYTVVEEQHPIEKLKVVAIDGRSVSIQQLQNQALLFKRPNLLIGSDSHVS